MWTPTTSSESSNPNRNLSPIAIAQTAPVTRPTTSAPTGLTEEHEGVIPTRPATAPEAAPRQVKCPSRIRSTINQPTMAAAVAAWVLVNVTPAPVPAVSAEPALNPNPPNHSRPTPRKTNGTLCGRIGSRRQPLRRPRTIANANPAAPEFIWTAVPPAKYIALSRSAIQPPLPPSKKKTQRATGQETSATQRATQPH